MQNIPTPVLDYACNLIVEERSLAYLLVAKDGRLLGWGGKLSAYGIDNLQSGEYASDRLIFLAGLLPLDNAPIFLPCTDMESGKQGFCADVHIFAGDEGDWVVLLDASLERKQHHLIQQKGNELSLLRSEQAKVLDRYFGKEKGYLAQGLLSIDEDGEWRDVTILMVKICGFTAYSKSNLPTTIFKTLNLYLSTIVQKILDEAGMIDKIKGDTVISLFGVLPSSGYAPVQALKAAFLMLESVQELNQRRQPELALEIAVGITSGTVALGLVGNKFNKTLCTIGDRVDLLVHLENQFSPKEILIDETTFERIQDLQTHFSAKTLVQPGSTTPITTYSYRVRS
ncbi:adenylate/guanylate cyclase domain-containing protein [Aliterella atlantica]|uniref:adenylate/guanylate cyclase domain-containing protein n=1 Tax=Aliterella atlantica TaxID=1827278 RepID=UPI000907DFA1|nr:adenylate/guanylate cyclase domain-containing protein [Aliterella atlantica]